MAEDLPVDVARRLLLPLLFVERGERLHTLQEQLAQPFRLAHVLPLVQVESRQEVAAVERQALAVERDRRRCRWRTPGPLQPTLERLDVEPVGGGSAQVVMLPLDLYIV